MAELNSWKAKRTVVKANMTKFKTAFNDIKNLVEVDEDSLIVFECKLSKAEGLLKEFSQIQLKIEETNELFVVDDRERDEFETSYYNTVPLAKRFLERHKLPPLPNNIVPLNPEHNTAAKLPSIVLPKFNGLYENWLAFHDGFDSLIHQNKSLDDVNKLHFLKSCLIGDAAHNVSTIETTAANYEVAWSALKARYANKRVLINKHIGAIYDIPSIQRESAIGLRQIIESVRRHINSLHSLGQNYEQCDLWLIYVLGGKLDSLTRRDWEDKCGNEIPTLNGFLDFINARCVTLENCSSNSGFNYKTLKLNSANFSQAQPGSGKASNCPFCNDSHTIYNCGKFLENPVPDRIKIVGRLKLCFKCLKGTHSVAQCKFSNCRLCQRTHNILLHLSDSRNVSNTAEVKLTQHSATQSGAQTSTGVVPSAGGGSQALGVVANAQEVLLSTAIVRVISKWGKTIEARVLIDSGSQSHFISSALCDKLGAHQTFNQIKLYGINGVSSDVQYTTNIRIISRYNNFTCDVNCLVVPKVTGNLPTVSFSSEMIKIPSTVNLADPQFYKSREIDILLGAEIFYKLICEGQYQLGNNKPTLQNTLLGYVLGGKVATGSGKSLASNHCIIHSSNTKDVECSLSSLWEDEVITDKKFFSEEEKLVEAHFSQTVQRNVQGRFIVTIPFKNNLQNLGESRSTTLKRFFNLERKLSKDPELKLQYSQFMKEYIELGHMKQIDENDRKHLLSYYIPHHPVLNKYSSTTKLRVVFDASAKTSTGLSLNEVQLAGPTIQSDLFELLIRFRQHKFILTADIAKMYRQVQVVEGQQSLQRIFWREDCAKPLQCYELTTVTYGLAASSYLAIRCLYQLGLVFAAVYPKAAAVIRNQFYVDDLLGGEETIQDAIQLRTEIDYILGTAGFHLRKWNSNAKEIIPTEDRQVIQPIGDVSVKTLGVWWNASTDTLQYSCDIEFNNVITKREILATTAKIFDPFGLLSPVVIRAKFMLQRLWQLNKSWDEPLPDSMNVQWIDFLRDLPLIRDIKVPRRALFANAETVEMHGFCDASERGYGACIYFRCYDKFTATWTCHLVCAKAKVSPIKVVNLPRLELNSAMLLARLVKKLKNSLLESTTIVKQTLWSDSTIALGWIHSCPSKWKTYVANRVSEIQINTDITNWRHVNSENNPADLITRGTSVHTLKDSNLWWTGPTWLTNQSIPWPRTINVNTSKDQEYLIEQRPKSVVVAIVNTKWSLIEQFSSLSRLVRVTAFCVRFCENCRQQPESRKYGTLSVSELSTALTKLIRSVQVVEFKNEIEQLRRSHKVDNNNKFNSLAPFLCNEGIMRVGGRLQKTKFQFGKMHPVLLPQKHHLTILIAQYTHIKNLHCGPQALLAILRENYWPICGRYVAKNIVHNCIKCYRSKPISQTTVTGQLPENRVVQAPPFFNTGVDYAGPFFIKDKRTRGNKLVKAYVCLFVCLVVKAIHLELVSDLTTEGFLAALRRFIARRGKPKEIHSDNATNFVGARNELKVLLQSSAEQVAHQLSDDGIEWHFIPPKSPHFGGIWEAGVKSVKTHLLRILGNANLVFEEFYTVLVQVEAVLNSRPLCPLSNDPNDMSALTPAHFLIGRTLTGAPDLDVTDVQVNRLSRFQRAQQLQQHFWARWNREYINCLQQRPTVRAPAVPATALKEGAMVVLREDGLPPLMWPLGRIEQLFPGVDGEVRVVSVRTPKGIFKREVRKVCILPIGHE